MTIGVAKPAASDEATRRRMASVRHERTQPELAVASVLDSLGFAYTSNDRSLPGHPDFYIADPGLAVFVHGCFWHRHAGCSKATMPKSNVEYWTAKFQDNQKRDKRLVRQLRASSIPSLILWQCQTEQSSVLRKRLRRRLAAMHQRKLG